LPAIAESPKVAAAALLRLARWWRQRDAASSGRAGDGVSSSRASGGEDAGGVDGGNDGIADVAVMGNPAAPAHRRRLVAVLGDIVLRTRKEDVDEP
jgi:hypothetical protein